MNASPSVETVLQALHALYRGDDISGKEKASIWLGELQKSIFAWQISDHLLMNNSDVESCYFAAQTMRTKIQYSFHELPTTSHNSLRDSLLNHLTKVTIETPPAIATQLCLAVADLALQMTSWTNAIHDLIHRLGGDEKHWHCLTEVLNVYPEEINSRSLRLGDNRRREVTDELRQTANLLIEYLVTVISRKGSDVRLQLKVYRCLGSWFYMCAIPQEAIVGKDILQAPFAVLARSDCPSDLHEVASDCVCSALLSVEDLHSAPLLADELFLRVHMLLDAYNMSVALEDIDKSIGYCRIFTALAETFLHVIVKMPNKDHGDFRTLELLLTCIGHHQYEVAEITFNFWYLLSEELYTLDSKPLSELFRPYIQRLIVALYRHCQFDPDMEEIPGRGDDFMDFRAKVLELIKDVVFIVGSSTVFHQMYEQLQHDQKTNASWESSEAALFVMAAVASNILPEEKMIVPHVMQLVLHHPPTHIMMRYTSIRLVGELAEWIEQNTHFIDAVLQFLLSGLQTPQLASIAAKSLVKICERCHQFMGPHFHGLIQIVQAIDSFSLSEEAALDLLRGAALILSNLPADNITQGLEQLCEGQLLTLNKILQRKHDADPKEKTPDPCKFVDRLATLFKETSPDISKDQMHPCQPVAQKVWPVLSQMCNAYQEDARVIERCCRCIRYLVRCLRKNSHVLLSPLVTQMVQLYSDHHHSCFLYLGSILVDEYGTEDECQQGLLHMFQLFCEPTFKQLEETDGLRNHPDTIDDFFRLCLRFIQKCPLLLLQSAAMKHVMICAIASVSIDHRDANSSVTKFLTDLFSLRGRHSLHSEAVMKQCQDVLHVTLEEHGLALLQAILTSCVFTLPTYMIPDSAEVLLEMVLYDRQACASLLHRALQALPTHMPGGVVTATPQQLTDFHNALAKAAELKQVTRAIREFMRLFR